MRGEVLEGQNVMGGQADEAGGIDGAGKLAAGAQGGFESFGGLVVRDHDDDGLAGGAGHQRNEQGAGGDGESGDTPAARTQAEVPAYAIECGGMLQLREDFADERENHALPV